MEIFKFVQNIQYSCIYCMKKLFIVNTNYDYLIAAMNLEMSDTTIT